MGTRSEIGTGLGTGRDTRNKRRKLPRNCLATDPEGREMNPCCVSQPETRQEMLPQWGGGDSGGQTNPFPYSQGTCQAVGMSLWRGCHPARALSLQKSPLLYLLSPQAWLAFFIYIYFFFPAGFCSPKVGHSHSTCLLQSSLISCLGQALESSCWEPSSQEQIFRVLQGSVGSEERLEGMGTPWNPWDLLLFCGSHGHRPTALIPALGCSSSSPAGRKEGRANPSAGSCRGRTAKRGKNGDFGRFA